MGHLGFLRGSVFASVVGLSGLMAATAGAAETTGSMDAAQTSAPLPMVYDTSRGGGVYGPTMSVDAGFDFYKHGGRPEMFAAMRNRGITAARIVDTGWLDGNAHKELADEVRAAGLAPVLCMFPPTHHGLYKLHPEWRQLMLGGSDGKYDWRTYLCPSRPEVRAVLAEETVAALKAGGYAGLQIAEPWFEQWGGPEMDDGSPRPGYACVCEVCRTRFAAASGGVDAREMLTKKDSPRYWRKPANAALYKLWQDTRVDAVTSMTVEIATEVRRALPGTVVNVMVLSDARVEPGKIREYMAIDFERLIKEVQPEILCVQDSWQDWTQKGLKPDFIRDYGKLYVERFRRVKPDLWLMSHADIGSLAASKREWPWIQQFAKESLAAGFNCPSFYEWSVTVINVVGEGK
ncbi:hypothetical protein CVU37_12830 [candidate division BRC1 bacterium HGW-BRC1-1]|jgi:hypothetical protein|nr:MAG: hypothetical protein CVU37_12830 [candidate division BRC1 bacterium HGW-BRC1-1]